MPRKSRNDQIREILKQPLTKEEAVEDVKIYEAYMKYIELEKHVPNCHCVRCMQEFYDRNP